jgi:hypothetical protein
MFTAYNDESGHPEQKAVVVAGFVASDKQWVEFERNWNDTLQEFGVSGFHAREYFHSVGEFAKWANHRSNPEIAEMRQRFLRQLIAHIKLRSRLCYSHAVRMASYHKVDEVYFLRAMRPYELCGRTAVKSVTDWANRNQIPQNQITHVFEDGAKHKGFLEKRIVTDKKFEPVFKNAAEAVPLQAADLLAYETLLGLRAIFEHGVTDFDDLRYPLRKLDEIPHRMEDWGIFEEHNLEDICKNIGIPRRDSFNYKDLEGMSKKEIEAEVRRRIAESINSQTART